MMKIFFCLFISLFLILGNFLYFWMTVNVLIFLGLYMFLYGFYLVDSVNFSSLIFIDSLSLSLMILSLWITVLMYNSSNSIFLMKNNLGFYYFLVGMLCFVLLLTFSSINFLSFYFYFEVSLIPTLLIILGWGYQPERLQAGLYFLFYTLTASLPLLLVFIYMYWLTGTMNFFSVYFLNLNKQSLIFFVGVTLAFLVKMPMFFTHLWLPKAHVEAPVSGSMILAGILLKLGGYGFYRVLSLSLGVLMNFGAYIFGLSIFGMAIVGFICCRLNDLKALVAYSSVAHMALVICGVYSMSLWGYTGGLAMMVAHGLASSGLFCIVNMFYERSGSRSIFMNKGLILIFPVMTFFIFLLSAANMAAPPTINLMSEIFLMVSILKFDKIMLLIFPLASYLGAVFTLFMFSFSQHGKNYLGLNSFFMVNFREFHIMSLHIIPVNFLILKPEFFLTV